MKPLPTEIWGEILLHLHQDEKLECMLVCHRWNDIIKKLVLYHSICIYSATHLKLLKNKMETYYGIASKLEQLVLSFNNNEQCVVYLKKLLPLLPNIRTFVCSGRENKRISIEKGTRYPWHNTIEHILEDSKYGISYQLLSTSVCPLLTTLTIVNSLRNIIPLLINAPALKHLSIHDLELRFDDIELIHESTHYLKSLTLTGVYFPTSNFHDDVVPATSMTECTIDLNNVELSRNRIDLLVYIYKKYPNLHKLSYHIDQFLVSEDDVRPLYGIGWIPLFKKFGPQLRTLSLDNNGFNDDLFTALGGFSCSVHYLQVNYLTQKSLSKLTKSQHSFNCIHTLYLKNTMITSFSWLKKLQVLKKLKLYFYIHGIPIRMDKIIKYAPPSLTSLSLTNAVLVFNRTMAVRSNIETLSLARIALSKKMDETINKYFSKLSRLKLKHCGLLGSDFHLPAIQLHHFKLADQFRSGNNFVVISEGNGQRIYNVQGVDYKRLSENTCKHLYYMSYPSIKSQSVDDSTDIPAFTLYCKSIQNVVFSE